MQIVSITQCRAAALGMYGASWTRNARGVEMDNLCANHLQTLFCKQAL
jgi:hypothetical protein